MARHAAGSIWGYNRHPWNGNTLTDTATIRVQLAGGTIGGATLMVGQSSGASYGIATIGVTQEYVAKDGLGRYHRN